MTPNQLRAGDKCHPCPQTEVLPISPAVQSRLRLDQEEAHHREAKPKRRTTPQRRERRMTSPSPLPPCPVRAHDHAVRERHEGKAQTDRTMGPEDACGPEPSGHSSRHRPDASNRHRDEHRMRLDSTRKRVEHPPPVRELDDRVDDQAKYEPESFDHFGESVDRVCLTLCLSRRRSAQRGGNPPAPLVGGRLEALVRRLAHR